ncbi:MAG: glycerate kinase [Lachnospiraceae bacterium]|nr:glycerate kinase [Lachnospiraceae bacterium]
MKAVIAIDSLKGSLSSMEAGQAIAEGIYRVDSQAEVIVRPLADGGEGTVDALVCGMNGKMHEVRVTGPLGIPVNCKYGIIEDTNTAVLEMSGAAGLTLVPVEKRNPLYTTTYGVGEVIKDAISKGCRRFIIGIGGSATNDGGAGMLQALGFGFLDHNGNQIPFGAKGLECLEQITDTYVIPELSECEFRIACDVTNILCGESGCSAVYGPQKGASPSMIAQMDQWLSDYASLAKERYPKADVQYAGCGAAGGLGFAFLTFTNAVLESGIKIILEETKLERYIENADIVVTGEGRLDGQTVMGKAPIGVARLAGKHHIPVIAFAGSVTKEAVECNANGIDAFFPVLRNIVTLDEAMKPENAMANLADTAEQVFRLMNIQMRKIK